jgi:hypothetical protein
VFVGFGHFISRGASVRVVFVIGNCVVVHKVADMDYDFTFTAVSDFNAEIQVVGPAERLVSIANY